MGRSFSRSHTGLKEIKAKVLDGKSKLTTVESSETVKGRRDGQTQNEELKYHSLFRKRGRTTVLKAKGEVYIFTGDNAISLSK